MSMNSATGGNSTVTLDPQKDGESEQWSDCIIRLERENMKKMNNDMFDSGWLQVGDMR